MVVTRESEYIRRCLVINWFQLTSRSCAERSVNPGIGLWCDVYLGFLYGLTIETPRCVASKMEKITENQL